jgi:hypothetical protein
MYRFHGVVDGQCGRVHGGPVVAQARGTIVPCWPVACGHSGSLVLAGGGHRG